MKSRYAPLDAMRGVAALFVVMRHFDDIGGAGHRDRLSFLAVDFFFVLSGFVLALGYGDAIAEKRLSSGRFLLARVIRLWPLYLLGLVIPAVWSLVAVAGGQLSIARAATTAATALVLLPGPPSPFVPAAFPLNQPSWSLFYEFWVANLLFAVIAWRRRPVLLGLTIVLSAVALGWEMSAYGTIDRGADAATILGGLPRVLYSFFIGVALQRLHERMPAPPRFPAWLALLGLGVVLSLSSREPLGPVVEIVAILAIFPALVFLGAGASERHPAIGRALGDASYAIYVLHFGILLTATRLLDWQLAPPGLIIETGCIAALVMLGWAANRWDADVRARLKRAIDRWLNAGRRTR